MPAETMTRAERSDLTQLVKAQARVQKAAASARAAELMADFERQMAAIYSFDDDEVWAKATRSAEAAVEQAKRDIAARCKELGIPHEFAPGLHMGWHGRGQNAVAGRRAELRRVASKRIEAMEKEARTRIEAACVEAQTALVSAGLTSDAAKLFLEQMPKADALMPVLEVAEVRKLLPGRSAEP